MAPRRRPPALTTPAERGCTGQHPQRISLRLSSGRTVSHALDRSRKAMPHRRLARWRLALAGLVDSVLQCMRVATAARRRADASRTPRLPGVVPTGIGRVRPHARRIAMTRAGVNLLQRRMDVAVVVVLDDEPA